MFDCDAAKKLLAEIRALDPRKKAFGAAGHGYEFGPLVGEAEVRAFEEEHGIALPADYRAFLTGLGDGGPGPFYGIDRLGMSDGEAWEEGTGMVGDLRAPFPHERAWLIPDELLEPPEFASDDEEDAWNERADRILYDPALIAGAFPICHHGCADRTYLVVTGKERGKVWFDGRPGGMGILPHDGPAGRMSFSDWWWHGMNRLKRELLAGEL